MCTEADDPEPAPRVDADVEPFIDDARLRSGRIFMNLLLIPGVILIPAATIEMERMGRAADLRAYGHDVTVRSEIPVPWMVLTYGMMLLVPNLAVSAVGRSVRRRRENLEPAWRGLIGAPLAVGTPVPAVMIHGVMVAVAPHVSVGSPNG